MKEQAILTRTKMHGMRFGLVFSLAIALGACAQQPVETPPAEQAVIALEPGHNDWWQQFESPQLLTLLAEATDSNRDLGIARERLAQANAQLRVNVADKYPGIGAGIRSSRNSVSTDGSSVDTNMNTLGIDASYSVDLWGARAAREKVEAFRLAQQRENLREVSLQLQADLAERYFETLALRDQIALAETALSASRELHELLVLKEEIGVATEVEVAQQWNLVLAQSASLERLQRDFTARKRAVALLAGRSELDSLETAQGFSAIEFPSVSPEQSLAMLEGRPDVRLAAHAVEIGEANLDHAKALRWPQLNLSADITLDDLSGGDLVSNLLAGLTAPVFQGGRIQGQIDVAKAETRIRGIQYEQIFTFATEEVLNALTAQGSLQRSLEISRKSLATSDSLFQNAKVQYDLGAADFLVLLDAQRSLVDARMQESEARLKYARALLNLFRVLAAAPEFPQVD
ncbi:hypothetical protein Mag101_06595 [Microbulbifer agarilyticus]|uniref:RND transporter n=1 Tax=Microbulbifer agarilyticus TaxID=260552 RepID=A0A1Q2M468_9GAMM|nr:TolC family protein [Microbulbifer agarilyticus]AQQ67338.1 hypothetical protein Mag101_06595 [Microbulbifer agarilyticus]